MSRPGGDGVELVEPWALRKGRWILVVGGAATLFVGIVAVFVLPTWDWAVGDFTGGDLQSARADMRSSGLAVAGGIGVTTAGLLAWGRIELSRREHHLAEQSQRNDRFTAAVVLLGHKDPSVRLGGLFAIEGLARDGHDRQTIYDIVCAYARNHRPLDSQDLSRQADYEAAITIATRVPESWEIRLDLTGTVIVGRRFTAFTDCDFTETTLTDCDFTETTLTNCSFTKARHTHCDFTGTTLTDCDFTETDFAHCDFTNITLTNCSFTRATLKNGRSAMATLNNCDFFKATLDYCDFIQATLADCNSFNATLNHCAFLKAAFADCNFSKAAFADCNFSMATFADCDFSMATFAKSPIDVATCDPATTSSLISTAAP